AQAVRSAEARERRRSDAIRAHLSGGERHATLRGGAVVTRRPLTDVAASARQRLLNNARQMGRPFNEVLQYFAMERFLYRLAQSAYADRCVLKGALMLTAWRAPGFRPTKDIDLLGRLGNNVNDIVGRIREICIEEVAADGLVFDPESVEGERIVEAAEYAG